MHEPQIPPEFPFIGKDKVEDAQRRAEDSKLFCGTYVMDSCRLAIMIKKGVEVKKETYDLLKHFQHNTLIPHLNFYPESNHGRFVIPIVEASFGAWFVNNWNLLINCRDGSMTSLFDTMIIDNCDLVEELHRNDILIKNLNWDSLYMAKEVYPRVILLVTEAEALQSAVTKIAIWEPVKELVERCYQECHVKKNRQVERYIGFIGSKNFTVRSLKRYPLNWDCYMEGEYTLAVIAASHRFIQSKMGVSGISWPIQKDGNLPRLLDEILEYSAKKGWKYSETIPFDYINLIRNTYKHFIKLPEHIKRQLGSKEGFIKMVEIWSPGIWQDLYDQIGWP